MGEWVGVKVGWAVGDNHQGPTIAHLRPPIFGCVMSSNEEMLKVLTTLVLAALIVALWPGMDD